MQTVFKPARFFSIAYALVVVTVLTNTPPGFGQVAHQTLYSFGHLAPDSSHPRANLIEGDDGALYGTSYLGGSSNLGCVFTLNRDGTGYSILWSFKGTDGDGAQPNAGLARGTDGVLYGTTTSGGVSNLGTVFRLNQDGTDYTVLKRFSGDDGANPYAAPIQATDGRLYGTTLDGGASNLGLVFSLATDGHDFAVLKTFTGAEGDGSHPRAALLQGADGALYGTTQTGGAVGNGTVFTLQADGAGFAVLRSFGAANNEGAEPYSALVQGTNGTLYGTTLHGGVSGQGTVFKLNPDGSGYGVVRVFPGGVTGANPCAALVLCPGGILCGTVLNGGANSLGAVFALKPDGTGFKLLKSFADADGVFPPASLLLASDGVLYGVAEAGGVGISGAVFKLNPDGSGFATIKAFTGSASDAVNPCAGLLQGTNGALFGTASQGGNAGLGAIFQIRPDGTGYTLLKSFVGTARNEGSIPCAALIQDSNGVLYGTTREGGTNSGGTIFRLNPDGSGFRVLRSLDFTTDGYWPYASLLLASNGLLYGTANYGGGTSKQGTVFRLNTNGSNFTVLRRFTGTSGDGAQPRAALVQGTNGALYGTTVYGGTNSRGTLFTLNLDGSGYKVLKQFTGFQEDGYCPYAALLQGQDGALYGTTYYGGKYGRGTVFRINPDGSAFATVLSLGRTYSDAASPTAALEQASSGLLYGTTAWGGIYGHGSVFQVNPDGSRYLLLVSYLRSATSLTAGAPLLFGNDGALYGTTECDGALASGSIFRLVPLAILLSPTALPTGIQGRFYGIPGCTYSVQKAVSITGPWTTLDSIAVGPDGVGLFSDSQTGAGSAFYRTTVP